MKIPDIDIDMNTRDCILQAIDHIPASIIKNDQIEKHKVGVYFQNIPTEEVSGYSSLDYKHAEELGYFKIDFLNNNIYTEVKNEKHLDDLLGMEPVWELLDNKEICDSLVHINGHYDIVKRIKPQSIEDLAIVLALIRPAKRHLVSKDINFIKKNVWVKPTDGSYYFSRAHSIAYASSIVVQMNLLLEP